MSSGALRDSLWDWAVEAYAAPGVGDACLTLQDRHEQNPCLLLWAAWSARTGRTPAPDHVEAACDVARAWETTAVAPLRAVRRTLKAPIPDMDDGARLALRDEVKAIELSAERRLLAELEALAPADQGPPRPILDALVAAARAWGPVTPRPALTVLAQRLSA